MNNMTDKFTINFYPIKEKKNDKMEPIDEGLNLSPYARFFDETCPDWSKDSEYNMFFLIQRRAYANSLLKSRGYLFLNEVYDMLGIPRSKSGQVVGWIYDKENSIGDNYVDFGLFEEHNKDFINGYKRYALLDFNVDGNIFEDIL